MTSSPIRKQSAWVMELAWNRLVKIVFWSSCISSLCGVRNKLVYLLSVVTNCLCVHPNHDGIIKRKLFPRYWPFVRGIHRPPVNSPPSLRSVTRSFDVFFDLCLNKLLSKKSWGWWFETPSSSFPWIWLTVFQRKLYLMLSVHRKNHGTCFES